MRISLTLHALPQRKGKNFLSSLPGVLSAGMSLKKESALPVPVTAQGAKRHTFKGRHTGSVSLGKAAIGGRGYSTQRNCWKGLGSSVKKYGITPKQRMMGLFGGSELNTLFLFFEYLTGSNSPHDLVGSGINLDKFGISHHSFNRIILHISITPKDLHSICSDFHGRI